MSFSRYGIGLLLYLHHTSMALVITISPFTHPSTTLCFLQPPESLWNHSRLNCKPSGMIVTDADGPEVLRRCICSQ